MVVVGGVVVLVVGAVVVGAFVLVVEPGTVVLVVELVLVTGIVLDGGVEDVDEDVTGSSVVLDRKSVV